MIATRRSHSKVPRLLLVAAGIALLSVTASATAITAGQASFGGTVDVTTGGVFFFNLPDTVPQTFDGGVGTGSYAGLTGGTIQNLLGPAVTGPISIVDFATFFTALGTIHFDLKNILPGVGTAAQCLSNTIGNQCTPTGSPFTLQQLASGVGITLNLSGVAYLTSSATGTTPTTGLFTAQIQAPGTITGVLAAVQNGTMVDQTYSANFISSPIPEPSTLTMLFAGAGMLGLGLIRKKKSARG